MSGNKYIKYGQTTTDNSNIDEDHEVIDNLYEEEDFTELEEDNEYNEELEDDSEYTYQNQYRESRVKKAKKSEEEKDTKNSSQKKNEANHEPLNQNQRHDYKSKNKNDNHDDTSLIPRITDDRRSRVEQHKSNIDVTNKFPTSKLKRNDTNPVMKKVEDKFDPKKQISKIKKINIDNSAFKIISSKYKMLILILGPVVLMVIIAIFLLVVDTNNSNNNTNYNTYNVPAANILYSVEYNGEIIDTNVSLNDLVAVILYSEIGVFKDEPEMLKAQAIAIRSYVLYNFSSGTVDANKIAYRVNDKDIALDSESPFMQATSLTHNLILTKDEEVAPGYFAAMCYYGTTTDSLGNVIYQIHYGGENFLLDDSKIQEIPKVNLDSYNPASSWFSSYCYGNHGEGMSQYGAYYLAKEKNYTYDEILYYYYDNNEITMMSYGSGSGEYENYTDKTLADTILMTRLSTFLQSNGSSLTDYNNYIYNTAVTNGVGTREAAVAVALTYTAYLYEMYNINIPYTYSGGNGGWSSYEGVGASVNSFYGADPDWGYKYSSGFAYGSWTFTAYGLDCSAYITWILKNAGFQQSTAVSSTYKTYGTTYSLNTGSAPNYTILPGDLVWQDGHIMFVVGTDLSNNTIYISHATGSYNRRALVEGISTTSSSGLYVVSMESYYNTKAAYTESEFESMFFANTRG
ncbi:MAG: hypothetical protein R3Y13_01540 [bacterium]